MNFIRPAILIVLFIPGWSQLKAQDVEVLSLDKAIEITLEHNHDIIKAEKNRVITENNVAIGNANMLPSVDLSAGYEYSSSNSELTFANPDQPPISESGAVTQSYNAGITMNYNIFSGGSKIFTYKKLMTQHTLGQLREQQAIEQTVLNVASKFLEVVRLSDTYGIQRESLSNSQERYNRAKEKYQFGSFDKLQLLNAEVDLRNDSITAVQDSINLEKAYKELNVLMGLPAGTNYEIDKSFEFRSQIDLEQLRTDAFNKNKSFLIARSNREISELDLKNSKAGMWPRLDLRGGYSYNYTDNEASFIQTQENLGWNAGITLSYNLFNGGQTRRNIENAKVSVDVEQTNVEQVELQVERNILNAYHDFSTNKQLLAQSRRNLELAKLNYDRSQEAYQTGQITGLELRDAQLNLLRSQNNVSTQKIQTKLSELNLLFYAGKIVEAKAE